MSYREPFTKIVTLTKRNHRYYGPTESSKFRGALTEIATDFKTIFNEIGEIKRSADDLAPLFLEPSGSPLSLFDLQRKLYSLESRLENRIYIQSDHVTILE